MIMQSMMSKATKSGDPMYYNDDWSMTYDGTDHSLSMIRLGSVGISDKPTSIHSGKDEE